jgi:YegS/Rv2252/BmrU family lipid kinase
VQRVAGILDDAGVEVDLKATEPQGGTAKLVRLAMQEGSDTVLAAGGDGTVHDVLQGMVGTDGVLGVIPMGTANALAHDLRLARSPEIAARVLIHLQPRRIAVGRIEFQNFQGKTDSRFFTVTAGVGADAQLFYDLSASLKNRLGIAAYYAKAVGLWLTRKMEYFSVRSGESEAVQVSQLLAVRIGHFGGLLRELAPGAGLHRNDLRLVLFHTNKRLDYLRYVLRSMLDLHWTGDSIELGHASSVTCLYNESPAQKGGRIFVEADGELLGTLPAKISIVPDALSLLMPGPLMADTRRRAGLSRVARPSFSLDQ